jgi:hypothetical protein
MSMNQIKRVMKRALRGPVLDSIQAIRRRWYKPPAELAEHEAEYRRRTAGLPAGTFRVPARAARQYR